MSLKESDDINVFVVKSSFLVQWVVSHSEINTDTSVWSIKANNSSRNNVDELYVGVLKACTSILLESLIDF